MNWKVCRLVTAACLLTLLTACFELGSAKRGKPESALPPIPAGIKVCAERHISAPDRKRLMTDVNYSAVIIVKLKKHGDSKDDCLRRLIALWEGAV